MKASSGSNPPGSVSAPLCLNVIRHAQDKRAFAFLDEPSVGLPTLASFDGPTLNAPCTCTWSDELVNGDFSNKGQKDPKMLSNCTPSDEMLLGVSVEGAENFHLSYDG